jgi:hypothetical protein
MLASSTFKKDEDDLFEDVGETSVRVGEADPTATPTPYLNFEGENVLDADMRDLPDEVKEVKEEKEEKVVEVVPVSYEEVQVRAMSVSDEGFCVFLQGLVSDRCLKVLVTPEDPMSEGLDRDAVETSEAVTLLQLLQGIDVETYLAKDALTSQFKGEAKQKYKLKLVLIDDVDGRGAGSGGSSEDKSKIKATFQALLAGAQRRSEGEATNTTVNNKELLSPVEIEAPGGAGAGGRFFRARQPVEATQERLLPVLDVKSGKTDSPVESAVEGTHGTIGGHKVAGVVNVTRSGFEREVQTKSAFFAIALALRHNAPIEVRSELLHDEGNSFTHEELKTYFPQIKETNNPLPSLEGRETILVRLQKRLGEAVRQSREDKVEALTRQIASLTADVPMHTTMTGKDDAGNDRYTSESPVSARANSSRETVQ